MSQSPHRPVGVLGSREALRAAIDARRHLAATTRLAARENRSVLPLSFVQERLWLLQRLDPALAAYNRCPAVRLRGPLDEARLARALNHVAAAHDVLRAGFQDRAGRPVQFIRSRVDMTPQAVDLTARIDAAREGAVREAARATVARPFDLAQDELVRPVLFRLAADDHVLLLVVHHTISDGWCDNIFLRLLGRAYDTDAPQPVPVLQYADFAAHQRAWFEGVEARRRLARAVERVSGYPHVLALPTTRARPHLQPTSGARVSVGDARLLQELTAAAAASVGATPFVVLLATFQVLLARLSGQERFLLGVPVAGRTRLEVEDMLGCFANTVVIPADVSDGCDFLTHVRRVQESTIDALDCQELPFEQLVNAVQPARDLSRAPLYQVLFGLHNTPSASVAFGGMTVSRYALHGNTSQVDLNLTIAETEDGLEGAFEYAVPLFDEPTVEAWRDHFLCLLAELPRSSGSVVRAPLWTPRHGAVVHRRNVDRRPSRPAWVDDRIRECIARYPGRVAIAADGETPTYRDLDRRAAGCAAALRDAGVRRGDRVGLLMERSPAMVAAMLGVWRAGAAYVPLDPACPAARAEYMLQDSGASLTIVDRATAAHERVRVGAVLFVDDTAAADGVVTDLPDPTAADIAYLIYTSGSTGAPKGVPVTHASLDNLLLSMAERPGFGMADRMLGLTTIAFDIAALELFLPLISGGSLVLAGARTAGDPRALIGLLDRDTPTVMQATPATWRMLLDAGWRGDRKLKALCGGEALPPVLARDLLDVVGELWNVYGPTETTIWSTAARVTHGRNPSLLGAPVANTGIFVLDRHLAHAPVMATGELCISGAGLSSGYWQRAALTAERFVSVVLDGQETRVYRTGDLARYRADGEVELLGRADHQVKIRGHRIELGEIEATLLRLPYIREAVVTVAGAPPHERLVAFVTAGTDARPTIESVRADAAAWLPDYMLPAQLVLLPAIPKTQNGKVDRAALPDPARAADARRPAPMTAREQAIARIWTSILDVTDLHPSDSFFSVGGNSLLAARVAASVHEELGIDVPLRALFERPTIAGIASIVEDGHPDTTSLLIADARWRPAVPVAPRASAGDAVVVTGATGFVGAFLAARLFEHDDRTVRFPIRAPTDAEALERLVAALQRYELWRDDWRQRMEVRAVDLVEASDGGEVLERLFAGAEACYHCAASVNFLMPYATLRAANVEATSSLLRAAAAAGSAFHYVSTMYVCDAAAPGASPVGESAALTSPERLRGGYPQSKWVAEQRVQRCMSEGLPGSILRLGRIGGALGSGAVSPADFLWQLVRTAIVLESFPEIDACVDLLAVDTAAEAIVALSRRRVQGPPVFHVASSSGVHLSAVSQWLEAAGYRLRRVPYRTWRASVQRETDGALAALASLLPEDPLASPMLNLNDRVDNRLTADELRAVDVSCPPVSRQTFLRSVQYLSARGLLPAPARQTAGV